MRFLRTQDDSGHTLHHVERRAEYRLIVAEEKRSRHFSINRVQVREDAILAAHVVRGFDLRADRRATKDELAVTGADQVSEIRKARGELFDREWAADAEMNGQIFEQAMRGQFFTLADLS